MAPILAGAPDAALEPDLALSPSALRARAAALAAEPEVDHRAERARRVINVVVAALGLVLAAPLMLVVAVLVKLDSRGPVIYRQERVGLDRRGGRERRSEPRGDPCGEACSGSCAQRRKGDAGGRVFTIYKFRTMTVAPPDAEQRWASRDDARVTRLGRFLRATRIDEIPQLVNVLKGDMNIVGPRPEQPTIFADLRQEVDRYPARQKVLPGITGLAQIELGYDTTIEGVRKKVDLDLEYIGQRSPAADLLIMARTMPVMVFRKVWM